MTKTKELFRETIKAVDVAKNIEDAAVKAVPYSEQLEMLQKTISHAESREEFEAYEQKIDDLKKDIKFESLYYQLSDEERSTIEHNFNAESVEAKKIYNKKRNEAIKIFDDALEKVFPIIDELMEISNKTKNARYVNELLNGNIQANPTWDGISILAPELRLYPNVTAGYNGTLNGLKGILSASSKALNSPDRYRIYNSGRGVEIQKNR